MNQSNDGGTHMPQKDTASNDTDVNDNPARLRIFEIDQDIAAEIASEVRPFIRDITQQSILRDAVHLGLPLVRKKLHAMCEAAKKAT